MSSELPDGFLDPLDASAVSAVLRSAAARLGMDGLVKLLAQVPGVRIDRGRPGGLLRRAVPARLQSGEYVIVLSEPAVTEHIVGGIVLGHQQVPPVDLPALLARVVADAVAYTGQGADASVALTSARDALGLSS
ncbi:MAG: hypothetical protein M3Z02_12130 [Actinomycetota bacterium]|nr:hypothetical protein [Actinomycetota bacterium]